MNATSNRSAKTSTDGQKVTKNDLSGQASRRSDAKSKARIRLVTWVAIFAATISLLGLSFVDRGSSESNAERSQRLSAAYACPVCAGQSVAESNAEVARTIREQIISEVRQGSSDEEIRDQLINQYGGEVLLNPPAEGVASLVWILPVLVVVTGAAGIAFALSGRRFSPTDVSDEDRDLVAEARNTALSGSEDMDREVDDWHHPEDFIDDGESNGEEE